MKDTSSGCSYQSTVLSIGVAVGRANVDEHTDFAEHLFVASTHSTMLFFTNAGRVFSRKVFHLPQGSRIARGKPIVNVLPFAEDERLAMVLAVDEFTSDISSLRFTMAGEEDQPDGVLEYSVDRIIAINPMTTTA